MGAVWKSAACAALPGIVRVMAGAIRVGSAQAAGRPDLRRGRKGSEAAQRLDFMERLPQALGHRLHAEFRKAVGLWRTLVRGSPRSRRPVGQSRENPDARQ